MICPYCQNEIHFANTSTAELCPVCPQTTFGIRENIITMVTIETAINNIKYWLIMNVSPDNTTKPILVYEINNDSSWRFLPINAIKTITPYNIKDKLKTYLMFL